LCRVETEHLGNADAYRVTREIPLPYRQAQDSDDDAKGMTKVSVSAAKGHDTITSRLRNIRQRLVGAEGAGRGPDALNVGARGHAAQREYEARRPGDTPGRDSDSNSNSSMV